MEKDIIEKYEKGETVKKITSDLVLLGKIIGIAFLFIVTFVIVPFFYCFIYFLFL